LSQICQEYSAALKGKVMLRCVQRLASLYGGPLLHRFFPPKPPSALTRPHNIRERLPSASLRNEGSAVFLCAPRRRKGLDIRTETVGGSVFNLSD
jgi:hypothetical protein